MPFREFSTPDGRRWRVWAVHPRSEHGHHDGAYDGTERRLADRRITPVELVMDPPLLERRRRLDRRRASPRPTGSPPSDGAPTARSPGLSERWRHGWLVFEPAAGTTGPGAAREVRRLVPIPSEWERCAESELVRFLAQAESRPEARRSSAP